MADLSTYTHKNGVTYNLKDNQAVTNIEYNEDHYTATKRNGETFDFELDTSSKAVSGNPVEFDDGSDSPLVKCVTAITGSQDLHGYSKPWVGGSGKNILHNEMASPQTVNGVTAITNDDGSITINGTVTANTTIYLSNRFIPAQGSYIFSGSNGGSSSTYGLFINVGAEYRFVYDGEISYTSDGVTQIYAAIRVSSGATLNNVKFYPMLRASGTTADFAPYSNICPITAYSTGSIEVRGKNLVSSIEQGGINWETGEDEQSSYAKRTNLFNVDPSTQYTASEFLVDTSTIGVAYFQADNTFIRSDILRPSSGIVRFTTPSNAKHAKIGGGMAVMPTELQVEKGSTATTYEPYVSNTYTIDLDGTRYGGTLDVVRGVLRVTHGYKQITSSSDLANFSALSAMDGYGRFAGDLLDGVKFTETNQLKTNELVVYKFAGSYESKWLNPNETCCVVNISANVGRIGFVIYGATSQSDFNTWVSNNALEVCYELATPIEVSLTPTAIRSLLGYNHIESTTGDLEVQYITQSYQPIIDLIGDAVELPKVTSADNGKILQVSDGDWSAETPEFATIDDTATDTDATWSSNKITEEIEDKTSVTKTATGNPIEISDGASAPLVKCVSAITGSQDLHGYDKPWVGGAGVNLLNTEVWQASKQGTVTATRNADGSYHLVGTLTSPQWLSISSNNDQYLDVNLPSDTYTVSTNDGSKFPFYINDGDTQYTNPQTFTGAITNIRIILKPNIAYDDTLKVQIEKGSQATAWTPYKNICPITAYTEGEIEVRSGDDIYTTTGTIGYNSSYIVTILTSDSFKLYTTSSKQYCSSKQLLSSYNLVEGHKYTIEADAHIVTGIALIGTRRSTDQLVAYTDILYSDGHLTLTFVYSSEMANLCFFSSWSDAEISEVIYSNILLYEGEPTTHTTTYPSAIYRGSEDVVNGSVEEDKVKLVFDGTETWYSDARWPGLYYTINIISNYPPPVSGGYGNDCLSNMYVGVVKGDLNQYVVGEFAFCHATITSTTSSILFMTNYSTVEEFKASISGGLEVVVPLQTPTTSSVTPTNLPIKSLSGYTHIESTTGDMEVEYITSEYQPLVDLIQSSKHVYSTAEQIVGTWIDGSTVYEKTYEVTNINSDNNIVIDASFTQSAIKLLPGCSVVLQTTGTYNTDFALSVISDDATGLRLFTNVNGLNFNVAKYDSHSSQYGTCSAFVTIRYTKSTPTRSLNLTKSAVEESR